MKTIEVKVTGSYLTKDSRSAGVQHEANVTILRIEFDESWDSMAKHVTFWDARGMNPVKRILTVDLLENLEESTRVYLCPIPGEALAEAGEMTFVIDGYVNGKRQRSFSAELSVTEAPYTAQAGEAADPTPTQAEQLQVQIDAVIEDIKEAVEIAETADEAKATADAALAAADRAEEMMKTGTHAARHQAGGDDVLTPDMIGAVPKQTVVVVGFDLNGVLGSGFYRLTTGHANMPAGCEYGQMLVIQGGGDTITQVCINYANIAYMRSGNPLSPSGGWSSWREIEFADKTVKKTGDYMSGRLHVPQLSITDYSSPLEAPQYIDFHSAGSVLDYNGRMSILPDGDLKYERADGTGGRVLYERLITKSTYDIGEGVAMLPGGWYAVYE